jgi:hypothetical protein
MRMHPIVAALAVGTVAIGGTALSAGLAATAGASATPASALHAKAPKQAKTAGCSSYHNGSKGVIRAFCTGKAVAKVTVGGVTTTLKGGTCTVGGGYFSLSVGVVIDATFKGPKPNYFGLSAPSGATTFTNATLTYNVNGLSGAVTQNTGTVAANRKSGTFSGTELAGAAVSGSFTC